MQTVDKLIHAIELQQQGDLEQAAILFWDVHTTDPTNAPALYSLSLIAMNAGNLPEALRISEYGVKVAPQFAPLWLVLGTIVNSLGNKEQALQYFNEALALDADNIDALLNSGVLLRELLRHHEALIRFNHVLELEPLHLIALVNCGILLTEFKQSEQAIAIFKRIIALKPDYDYALGLLAYEQLHICDWSEYKLLSAQIIEGVLAKQRTCKTLAFMSFSDSAAQHFQAAKLFAEHYCPKQSVALWKGERYRHEKIRIAYISPDFREHPVCHLIAGVIEQHDKHRFETIAISLGIDDGSRLRQRMLATFDQFIDAKLMNADKIAQLIKELEVDIAIDLAGYTSDSRTHIFAHRPAPVQVNYLGYAATLGTEYMDYIIADKHVIPETHHAFYSEKVVYLPDTYLPTDNNLIIAEHTPSREECGLPSTGIVFCSFSHDFKISPDMFALWMRLLQQVPNSTLWLMSRNEISQQNLRAAAFAADVNPTRLVFAGRVPLIEDHLARYRLADIFLDTHPYNAHTTAADALMVGLPVVTYMGDSFPSRVAGSLLHAAGLPELIANSYEKYEQIALNLATQPQLLHELKQTLQAHHATTPLFNTRAFTRNLEAIYTAMWRKTELGDARDALS